MVQNKNYSEDEKWMREAIKEAHLALKKKEVPVGAVIVYENKIIGRGYNQVESLKDATAHAEILAITAASNFFDSWRLEGTSLYVTLEPCVMCAGAIVLSRIERLVIGAFDPKQGACGTLYNIVNDTRLNHQVEIVSEILKEECSKILTDFFQTLRTQKATTNGGNH